MLPTCFGSFDTLSIGLLTVQEIQQISQVAEECAKPAVLAGGVGTSREPVGTQLSYGLMDGIAVKNHIPKLDSLYRSVFLELAERVSGQHLQTSPDIRNGVNVNVLGASGSRYERHVDSNPLTGLLIVGDWDSTSGGRLLFGAERHSQTALSLFSGQLLLFDARAREHSVEAIKTEAVPRVSVPMNYFKHGSDVQRPAGLDEMLYGSST